MSGTEIDRSSDRAVDASATTQDTEREKTRRRYRNLPNQITISRMFLSLVFFVLIVLVNYGVFGVYRPIVLNLSIGLFALTAITDFFDGYIARRLEIVSTFGRIADPIADKIFICGSFVLLVDTCDLLPAWIPVLIMSREFLISGLRGFIESRGVPFGAGLGGKLKMGLQSLTVPVILLYEANFEGDRAWRALVVVLIGATVLLTFTSCIGYIRRAIAILHPSERGCETSKDPTETGPANS